MKKRTKILLIAGIVILLVILSPALVKLRCRLFLYEMNRKTAIHTISETHIREYAGSPDQYLDSSKETREWFHEAAGLYVESVSGGGVVSARLNGMYKNVETDYQWQMNTILDSPQPRSFWEAYTWEYLSKDPVSVQISDGLIQVVFHTSNTGTNYNKTELSFRFNFLLQFDSVVSESVTYADEAYDPGRLSQESTTVYKIVTFKETEILDKINEQYALIKGVS